MPYHPHSQSRAYTRIYAPAYATYFHAQESVFVFVTTVMFATYDMDASASPRKPYVVSRDRSENLDSLDVVKRSARMGKSSCYASVSLNRLN